MNTTTNKPDGALAAQLEMPFRVEQITEAPAPDGSDAVWYRYVISQGTNTIVGLRAGVRAEVAVQVEEMVARLNERLGKIRAKTR